MKKNNYTNNIEGWMRKESFKWLLTTASKMDSIIEVGCWKGRSTHALLTGCKGIVYAVDHFKGSPNEVLEGQTLYEAERRDICEDFLRNVGMFSNLKLLKMESKEAVKLFKPKSVDMVFIDASHIYEDAKTDLEIWTPIAKKLVCGHDYKREVKQAVDEKFGENNVVLESGVWSVVL